MWNHEAVLIRSPSHDFVYLWEYCDFNLIWEPDGENCQLGLLTLCFVLLLALDLSLAPNSVQSHDCISRVQKLKGGRYHSLYCMIWELTFTILIVLVQDMAIDNPQRLKDLKRMHYTIDPKARKVRFGNKKGERHWCRSCYGEDVTRLHIASALCAATNWER